MQELLRKLGHGLRLIHHHRFNVLKEELTGTVRELKTRGLNIAALIEGDRDVLKARLQEASQTVLAAEMTAVTCGLPDERTAACLGDWGFLSAHLLTRVEALAR